MQMGLQALPSMQDPTRPASKETRRAGSFFLAVLPILSLLVFGACDEGRQEPRGIFVLSDQDTTLTCDASGSNSAAFACQLVYYANRERRHHPVESGHARDLEWDEDLASVALNYSHRMCAEGFFDHQDPQGRRVESRLADAGVFYVKAGENLARGEGLLPAEVMSLFMDEPPCAQNHRGNVLDPAFTHSGTGMVECSDKAIYTQLFAVFDVDALDSRGDGECRVDP